jgi:beta-galactosidase/beta-glucuronidase
MDPGFHSVVWYQRRFNIPEAWQRQRVVLHFGAVDYLAQVWVNGQLVIEHEGGHTPFSADITDVLVAGEQLITVRAADDPLDLEKPRGKQDWQLNPHAIWYPRTSGIWQPVWLEPVPETSIAKLRMTPDIDSLAIEMEVEVEIFGIERYRDLRLDLCLAHKGEMLVEQSWPITDLRAACQITLPAPGTEAGRQELLWSPENPALFDLSLTLRWGETIMDQVESYAALRSVEAREGAFYLNGRPYFLQMVLDQGYWIESHLAAPDEGALRKDVELTKAMGFNGARKHQKIEDPRYLYWADRLGLLVWGELPSAYRFSREAARRLTHEFIAMIERDYNHPSVVAWVPFNESWGIPDLQKSAPQRHLAVTLYHLAKALDSTRLVVDNDGWEHSITDLFTVHDYENKPEIFAHRYGTEEGLQEAMMRDTVDHKWVLEGYSPKSLPVILSEFGGVRMGGDGPGWGYVQVKTPDEFLDLFAPLMKTAYGKTLTGYCYTQLTDTFQEQNGLLYADRRPKVDPAIIARILREGMQQRAGEAPL